MQNIDSNVTKVVAVPAWRCSDGGAASVPSLSTFSLLRYKAPGGTKRMTTPVLGVVFVVRSISNAVQIKASVSLRTNGGLADRAPFYPHTNTCMDHKERKEGFIIG